MKNKYIFRMVAIIFVGMMMSNMAISEGNNIKTTQYYGESLFKGNFKSSEVSSYNNRYILSVGDSINLKLWGAINKELEIQLDNQGNAFIPEVGVINLKGVVSKDLNGVMNAFISKKYKTNVKSYSNLVVYKNIEVFVSGYTNNPGSYAGSSLDNILKYLDKSGGINEKGSYRDIDIVRDGTVIKKVDLYRYMSGKDSLHFQFRAGDVIHVNRNKGRVVVEGEQQRKVSYELMEMQIPLKDLLDIHIPNENHTHVNIKTMNKENFETTRNIVPIDESYFVGPGDVVTLLSRTINKDISVLIEGEILSDNRVIVKPGDTLAQLINGIKLKSSADIDMIQVYRKSIKESQQEQLRQYAFALRRMALRKSSASVAISETAKNDAERVDKFAEKVLAVVAEGQLILGNGNLEDVVLEDGDRVYIPNKKRTVSVFGEVMFPNTYVYKKGDSADKYINMAGLISEDGSRVIVKHANGIIEVVDNSDDFCTFGCRDSVVRPGDKIMVLPNIVGNNWEYSQAIVKIIYQLAVSASIVIGI